MVYEEFYNIFSSVLDDFIYQRTCKILFGRDRSKWVSKEEIIGILEKIDFSFLLDVFKQKTYFEQQILDRFKKLLLRENFNRSFGEIIKVTRGWLRFHFDTFYDNFYRFVFLSRKGSKLFYLINFEEDADEIGKHLKILDKPDVLFYLIDNYPINKVKFVLKLKLNLIKYQLRFNKSQSLYILKNNILRLYKKFSFDGSEREGNYQELLYRDYVLREQNYKELDFRKKILNKLLFLFFLRTLLRWFRDVFWNERGGGKVLKYGWGGFEVDGGDSQYLLIYSFPTIAPAKLGYFLNRFNYYLSALASYEWMLSKENLSFLSLHAYDVNSQKIDLFDYVSSLLVKVRSFAERALETEFFTIIMNYFYLCLKKFFSISMIRRRVFEIFRNYNLPEDLIDEPQNVLLLWGKNYGFSFFNDLLAVPFELLPFDIRKIHEFVVLKFRRVLCKINLLFSQKEVFRPLWVFVENKSIPSWKLF